MEFMLLIIDVDETVAAAAPAEIDQIMDRHTRFGDELRAAGAWIETQRLRPGKHAATVRRRQGKPVVVDGPFAESKEVLGGFYRIRAASMEEAIEWAKKLPTFPDSAVEVRPIWGSTRTGRWSES